MTGGRSVYDGAKLFAAAERMGLEGVVSKRRDGAYRSGPRCGWIKVKTQAWREANKERWRLFEQLHRAKLHATQRWSHQ